MVEVDNVAGPRLVKDLLDSVAVVGHAIADGTPRLDADEVRRGDVLVLRLAAGNNLAGPVKERRGLVDRGLGILDGIATVGSVVDAPLDPRGDVRVAVENGSSGSLVADGDGDVVGQIKVVNDERTVCGRRLGRVERVDGDGGVAELAV